MIPFRLIFACSLADHATFELIESLDGCLLLCIYLEVLYNRLTCGVQNGIKCEQWPICTLIIHAGSRAAQPMKCLIQGRRYRSLDSGGNSTPLIPFPSGTALTP